MSPPFARIRKAEQALGIERCLVSDLLDWHIEQIR